MYCRQGGRFDWPQCCHSHSSQCYFCAYKRQIRNQCQTKKQFAIIARKNGHYGRICRSIRSKQMRGESKSTGNHSAAMPATLFGTTLRCISKSVRCCKINGIPVITPVDTGNSENFIRDNIVQKSYLTVYLSLVDASHSSKVVGHCIVNSELQGEVYSDVTLKSTT